MSQKDDFRGLSGDKDCYTVKANLLPPDSKYLFNIVHGDTYNTDTGRIFLVYVTRIDCPAITKKVCLVKNSGFFWMIFQYRLARAIIDKKFAR